VALAVEV